MLEGVGWIQEELGEERNKENDVNIVIIYEITPKQSKQNFKMLLSREKTVIWSNYISLCLGVYDITKSDTCVVLYICLLLLVSLPFIINIFLDFLSHN